MRKGTELSSEGSNNTIRLHKPRRVAVLSVHTSPLDQPGTGDAGGMNVYITQTATRMARRGIAVEVFTRATSSDLPPVAELAPGVLVRHVSAGPFEGLDRAELPAQLCAFTAGVLRAEARREPGYYDLVHSHYWLSGQVGWLARARWGVLRGAAAELLAGGEVTRERLLVLVAGGPSGTGLEPPAGLQKLAAQLGISDVMRFLPPQPGAVLADVYRAADVVAVPSHNESFGLVALEAQACGTPVVATAVGGLRVAVAAGAFRLLAGADDP